MSKVITVSNLVRGKKIPGIVLRRKLRAAGVKKPGKRWQWPAGHRDLAKVKQLIKH